jgi:hypothetical protein
MKSDLKRIEAALQQATRQPICSGNLSPSLPLAENPFVNWDGSVHATAAEVGLATGEAAALAGSSAATLEEMTQISMALSRTAAIAPTPDLPDFVVRVSESSRQQAMATPALANNLLSDLQHRVEEWTLSLQEILEQIQALQAEGPIVEGWLESSGATYRLCGVNEDGQLWHHPCPNETILDTSLAIVRYQRLQQLLSHKRSLEIRLTYLTETLLSTYSRLAQFS